MSSAQNVIDFEKIKNDVRTRVFSATRSDLIEKIGYIVRTDGEVLHVSGIRASIGSRCMISSEGESSIPGEVIGFNENSLLVMPEVRPRGIMRGAIVKINQRPLSPAVGYGLLGRVLDSHGNPFDQMPPPDCDDSWPIMGKKINPMEQERIDSVLDVGVRSINALTTIGRGMRVGLFAGSGVGKTTLLGMMARNAKADVIVVAMIGERSREIKEFIEDHLGHAKDKTVVVATPASETELSKINGAYRAAAYAEYFRDQGKHVLFIVDSLTRFAMALRGIGTAAGEPPSTRGYPASVFEAIPEYVERAGMGTKKGGSITGIYTVLVEGDDHISDPVADSARSVMDGHIVLSRKIAEQGIYPPIDHIASLSRIMPSVVSKDQVAVALHFKALLAKKAEKQDVIDLGAYKGGDPKLDEALKKFPAMEEFLIQDRHEGVGFDESINRLIQSMTA